MKMLDIIAVTFALLALRLSHLVDAGRTNFVIVVADDLGWGDVGFNGGIARTPNFDSMVKSDSVLHLANMHSRVMCAPSRMMLLTGQHPERNCIAGNSQWKYEVPSTMTTIANDASKTGYRTAFFGKLHITLASRQFLINQFGFDKFVASTGNLFSFNSTCLCDDVKCNAILGRSACQGTSTCIVDAGRKRLGCYAPSIPRQCYLGCYPFDQVHQEFVKGDKMECGFRNEEDQLIKPQAPMFSAADVLVDEFEEFVQTTPSSTPMLAVVAFTEPHEPFTQEQSVMAESAKAHKLVLNSLRAHFVAAVETVDRAFGRVRDILKANRRLNNTFLLFVSDNGPETHAQGGAGSPAPLRGWKRTVFEGGTRVPSFLEWPCKIAKNGKVMRGLTSLMDVRSTIRAIINRESDGITFPTVHLDGESFLGLLDDPQGWRRNSTLLICQSIVDKTRQMCPQLAVYKGNMKVIGPRVRKLARKEWTIPMVFDINTDMEERRNLHRSQSQLYTSMLAEGKALAADAIDSFTKNKCPPIQ